MPTYDYRCRDCGATVEVIHSMLEEGPRTCQRCGGELRRVLYPAGIIFKGSGFYRTDSRSSGTEASARPKGGAKATTSGNGAPAGGETSTAGESTGTGGTSGEGSGPAPSPSSKPQGSSAAAD